MLFLGATVLLWGTSFAVTKSAFSHLPPLTVIWLRMAVASLVLFPFWPRLPRPGYRRGGDWRLLALAGLFLPCLYFTLEAFAMTFTSSGQAGVVSATAPLLVAVAAWTFLAERLSWRGALGIGISIAGVALLSFGGPAQASAPLPLLGNLLELGAMIAAAGSAVTIKHLSARYDPWLLTGFQSGVGVLFFAPLAFASPNPSWESVPATAWAQWRIWAPAAACWRSASTTPCSRTCR